MVPSPIENFAIRMTSDPASSTIIIEREQRHSKSRAQPSRGSHSERRQRGPYAYENPSTD